MDLKTYISDTGRKDALALALNSSGQYLWQIANGWRNRKPSPQFARRVFEATGGQVTLHELRPDIWNDTQRHDQQKAA